MKMKKIILAFLLVGCTLSAAAQDVYSLFLTMPQEETPYLSGLQKLQLLQAELTQHGSKVENLLKDSTSIEVLMPNFLYVHLNEARDMQIKKLPMGEGDSILCVVNTYKGKAPESSIAYYSFKWEKLEIAGFPIPTDTRQLHMRPVDMDETKYKDLLKLLDPVLIQYVFDPVDNRLFVHQSMPLLSEEERKEVGRILHPIIISWPYNSAKQ